MVATVALGFPLLIPSRLYTYLTNKTIPVQYRAGTNAPNGVEILQNPIQDINIDTIQKNMVFDFSNRLDLFF